MSCGSARSQSAWQRSPLVLATKSHLPTAEAAYLQDGPHLPGHSARHGLLFGCALDARNGLSFRIVGSQESGDCSTTARPWTTVQCRSERRKPTVSKLCVRQEPVLNAPGSDLVLPPEAGLLIQGCYWPTQQNRTTVLAVLDAETEAEQPATTLPHQRQPMSLWHRRTPAK